MSGQELTAEGRLTTELDGANNLLLIADGMGGQARGEVASALVVQLLNARANEVSEPDSCLPVLREANRHVYLAAAERLGCEGMGTTVVGVVLQSERFIWFNVGDSRLYRWRAGELQQVSVDHVPDGQGGLHRSHVITQSLGGLPHWVEIWPAIGVENAVRGDWLILCSDGLTDCVPDPEIVNVLGSTDSPNAAVDRLIRAAFLRGAPDNITVLIAAEVCAGSGA